MERKQHHAGMYVVLDTKIPEAAFNGGIVTQGICGGQYEQWVRMLGFSVAGLALLLVSVEYDQVF